MSYSIDVYRRDFKPEKSLLAYINFVLFFPHLVAGPILRAKDLIWQLKTVRPIITPDELRLALCQILWGLFKKIVFADNLGDLVSYAETAIRTDPTNSPGAALLFSLGFALQIYCDFSAYSDIARGTAQLFGVKLPRNFLTPMFSRGPREFWQRWHITLSTWIRDYLYIPLGGNKGGYLRQASTLLLTMGIAGLWHGANVMFIFWGLYHGTLIIAYRLPIMKRLEDTDASIFKATFATSLFAFLNLFGWLMFRIGSGSSNDFMPLIKSMGQLFNNFHAPIFIGNYILDSLMLLSVLALFLCSGIQFAIAGNGNGATNRSVVVDHLPAIASSLHLMMNIKILNFPNKKSCLSEGLDVRKFFERHFSAYFDLVRTIGSYSQARWQILVVRINEFLRNIIRYDDISPYSVNNGWSFPIIPKYNFGLYGSPLFTSSKCTKSTFYEMCLDKKIGSFYSMQRFLLTDSNVTKSSSNKYEQSIKYGESYISPFWRVVISLGVCIFGACLQLAGYIQIERRRNVYGYCLLIFGINVGFVGAFSIFW